MMGQDHAVDSRKLVVREYVYHGLCTLCAHIFLPCECIKPSSSGELIARFKLYMCT